LFILAASGPDIDKKTCSHTAKYTGPYVKTDADAVRCLSRLLAFLVALCPLRSV